MPASTVSITLEQSDLDYAKSLVERGLYDSVDAAIRGELTQIREFREAEDRMLVEEVKRRLELPEDQYITIDSPTYFSDRFKAKYGPSGSDT